MNYCACVDAVFAEKGRNCDGGRNVYLGLTSERNLPKRHLVVEILAQQTFAITDPCFQQR